MGFEKLPILLQKGDEKMTDLKYWLWLTLTLHQQSRKVTALLEKFDTPLDIYSAKEADFRGIENLTSRDIKALCNKSLKYTQKVMDDCRKNAIRIMTFDSPYYPKKLANIFDPPYVLYVKSAERIDLNNELTIAMIGTREMTKYGRVAAIGLANDLASAGVTIVSGMARGIDGASLSGALRAGGKTIAVLGCGADIAYPPEHDEMMEQIAQTGMVITEYPPGSPPLPQHFPVRNRIISGLCSGTVVVESPASGGSLITASLALEQGRDVFAVPGNINSPYSDGANELIRNGAHLISSALDIISEYRDEYINIFKKAVNTEHERAVFDFREDSSEQTTVSEPEPARPVLSNEMFCSLPDNEKQIVDALGVVPMHADILLDKTKLSAQELNAALTMLEMKGIVRQHAGRHFALIL